MEQNAFSVRAIIKQAFAIAEDKLWGMVGSFTALLVASIILSAFSASSILVSIVVSTLSSLALLIFGLTYAYGSNFRFEMLFERITVKIFVYYLLSSVFVSLIVMAGTVLLIVPGIIAAMMLFFTQYLVVNKNLKPFDAMRESRAMTRGYRWKLFLFVLAMIGINLLALICFIFGLLFTLPMTMIAFALAYKELLNKQAVPASLPPQA